MISRRGARVTSRGDVVGSSAARAIAGTRTTQAAEGLDAAYIATCVGSLTQCTLRLANADRDRPNEIKEFDQTRFEIVSCVGTVSPDGAHIHVCVADAEGRCFGGHLMSATIFTTAEIVLGDVSGHRFARAHDPATGFPELVVVRDRPSRALGLEAAAVGVFLVALGLALAKRR